MDVETAAKRRRVENHIEMGDAGEVTPRRSPNGYLLPLPVPVGIILTDLKRRQWKIGKSIGLGGFGEIYSAELFRDPNSCESPNSNATFDNYSKIIDYWENQIRVNNLQRKEAIIKKGQALIWHANLLHGGMPRN